MENTHFASRMLIIAGTLLTISGILTAICVKIVYGGILFAAASCMFSAARSIRIAEDRNDHKQLDSESGHEPEDPQEG